MQVGGGMGRTHRNESTFARLAEPLGYVPKEDILSAVKAIVVTQRENGRRDDRKYSRMKYLISSWGIEKFKSVFEQYHGKTIEPCHELPEWEFKSYLGWHKQVGYSIIICDNISFLSRWTRLVMPIGGCFARKLFHGLFISFLCLF